MGVTVGACKGDACADSQGEGKTLVDGQPGFNDLLYSHPSFRHQLLSAPPSCRLQVTASCCHGSTTANSHHEQTPHMQ